MTRSLFGSVKEKLSRSSSTGKSLSGTPINNAAPASPNDLPPPYSPTADTMPRKVIPGVTEDDDPYAFLSNYDTIFLIDDSASMLQDGRWREAERAISAITPICTSHDSDGIDIYFLNHKPAGRSAPGKADGGFYGITHTSTVSDIFARVRPSGATPTGQRLRNILRPYMQTLERSRGNPDTVKPINIIVITDGRATDEPEEIIVNVAAKLDQMDAAPSQVGIQFFQIGNAFSAAEGLQHLDDDLKSRGVRDMVDTCTWNDTDRRFGQRTLTSDAILKVVLGAVLRRLDNKSVGRSRR